MMRLWLRREGYTLEIRLPRWVGAACQRRGVHVERDVLDILRNQVAAFRGPVKPCVTGRWCHPEDKVCRDCGEVAR
jgi:hypothetical protein